MADNHHIEDHLKELGKSGYEISEGQSDIRGWSVKNEYGKILGKVNDLIFDTHAKKVKYLVLDLDGNELYLQSRKVLLPLDITQLDEVYKNVIFPGLLANELTSLPTYERGRISTTLVTIINNVFSSGYASTKESHSSLTRSDSSHEPVQYAKNFTGDTVTAQNQQTVIGLFDYTSEAQSTVAYLKESGFKHQDIEISYKDKDQFESHESKEGISGFFNKLFSPEESNWLHSNEASRYSVVAVKNLSLAEAERAAEIMDNQGAINIDDRFKEYREKSNAAKSDRQSRTYHSRII